MLQNLKTNIEIEKTKRIKNSGVYKVFYYIITSQQT